MNGHAWLFLFCLFVGWLVARRSSTSSRTISVRTHTHVGHSDAVERDDVRDHEAGHWVVGRALGGYGGRAVARPDGSGYVTMNFRQQPTPVERIAISRAGALAEGSEVGAGFDQKIQKQALRRVPARQRAQVAREGDRLARRLLSQNRGELRRVSKKLKKGVHR